MDLHSTTELDFDRRFFRSVSPAAQREAIAREQDQLEIISLQRTALNSARDAVFLLQLQLRRGVQNDSLSATPLAPSRPTSSSPPPAFTSGSAALRLQALARQTEAEGLAMKLQEIESRASSRAVSRIASRAVSRASSELGDDSEMESDSDDEDEEADEERESNIEWWRDQRRLEQGEVDVNGVRIKRVRRRGHAIPERAGR